jgi:predicted peptidase
MSLKLFTLLLVGATIQSCDKQSDEEITINKMSAIRGYKNWYIGKFRCGIFVPPTYDASKKYPVIVILHGHSDTTSWNYRWYNEPFLSKDPCIVLSPKCPVVEEAGWGSSWRTESAPMIDKAFEMMELAKKAFNLDTSRLYIHGTSMGAIGIYGVLQKKPGLFAAAYLECGAGNPQIAPLLVKTPLWIFHGSNDYVVPAYPDRDMYDLVRESGGTQIRYTEYQGVGHDVWNYTKNETTLPWWLLAQKKGEIHGLPDSTKNFSAKVNESLVNLEWQAPADSTKKDNQIWFYRIYRNGELLKELDYKTTSYIDSSALSNTLYAYQVSVLNFFFKESARSKAVFLKKN